MLRSIALSIAALTFVVLLATSILANPTDKTASINMADVEDLEVSTRSSVLDELVKRSLADIAEEVSRLRQNNAQLEQHKQQLTIEKEHIEECLYVSGHL